MTDKNRISRRTVITTGLGVIAAPAVLLATAAWAGSSQAAVPANGRLDFTVMRNGEVVRDVEVVQGFAYELNIAPVVFGKQYVHSCHGATCARG